MKYINKLYNIIIIEIKEEDNINNYLELDDNIINNIINKKNKKNILDNRNNQLVIQNQSPVDLTQSDDTQMQSASKLKYLYLKCIFFKKVLKNQTCFYFLYF